MEECGVFGRWLKDLFLPQKWKEVSLGSCDQIVEGPICLAEEFEFYPVDKENNGVF
jgi:hypothetical protein